MQSKTLSTARPRPWKSTTLKRTWLPSSSASLTRSTTRRGTALLAATLDPMSHTRPSTSFTSTSAKSPFSCSSRVKTSFPFAFSFWPST